MRGVQGKLNEQLGGPSEKAGKSAGGKISGALGKVLKRGVLAVGAAAGGALATSLWKGWGRLTQIENAQSKLQGLGHDAKSVKTIMDNALASVRGTAFGLGDAAGLAATLVASGIKPGTQLESTLKRVADSASIAGVDLKDMGMIWSKAAAKGKIDGNIVNMMLERQIPIYDILGKKYNKNAAEIAKMVSKGKVSFKDFSDAMNGDFAGAALASGSTTQGAFDNMMAAAGRFGAALMIGVFPIAKLVFGSVTRFADWATDAIKPLGEALGGFFLGSEGPIQQFISGFTLARDEASAMAGDLDGLVKVGSRVKDFVVATKQNVMDFIAGFTLGRDEARDFGSELDGVVAIGSKVRDAFDSSWDRIQGIFEKLKTAATGLAPAVGGIGKSLGEASAKIGVSTWRLLLTTVDALASVLNSVLVPAIQGLAGWMSDHEGTVTVLVGAYTAYRLASIGAAAVEKTKATWTAINTARTKALSTATKVATASQKAWTTAVNAAKYTQIAGYLAALKVKTVALGAASKAAAVGQRALNAAVAAGNWVAQAAKLVAYKAVQLAISAATKAWAAVQWVLNVALNANPIGLIVLAIAALVGAVILAYKKSDTFRKIVDAAFRAVGAAAKWLWEKAIKPAFQKIADFAAWLWGKIKQSLEGWKLIFDKVKGWLGSAKDWMVNKFTSLVDFVKGLPGKISKAASGMWDGIKNAFRSALNWLISKWNGLSLKIPSIDTHIPGIGKIGGFTLRTAQIPKLAEGGIVPATPGGRIVRVAEAGKAEAIAPLDKLERMLGGRGGGPDVLELTLDLGEGIREVVRINLRENNRQIKRRAAARGALAGAR
ncbi:tape measure protein [Rhizomonospora bruguierae]|uniref:tape measure protein n=1 Tax=Rhizomonospora bruguierae TaxID=1581705 RepID=UPI001BD0FA14|nr:tape measure protein [Micromonospora sp. NBRC 107566]